MSTLWFPTASLTESAQLAGAIVVAADDAAPPPLLDLRPSGLRIRSLDDGPPLDVARLTTVVGRDSDPIGLQHLSLTLDSHQVDRVAPFWQTALGHGRTGDVLHDPFHRLPDLRLRHREDVSALRGRPHLDIGYPGPTEQLTDQILATPGSTHIPSEWYGTLVDADRNELDLVPGGPLDDDPGTSDWQASFSGFALYRCSSPGEAADLAHAIAALTDASDADLLVGLDGASVLLDSGKDRWEASGFVDLARDVQRTAHDVGARARPGLLRFVQIGLDTADIPAARAFWSAVLGYRDVDPRITDLHDPRWLDPVIFFQHLDTDTERLAVSNRLQPEVRLAPAALADRVEAGVAAGGRVVDGRPGDARLRLADPEGNEATVVAAP